MKENSIEEDIEILEELKETYRFLISIRTEEIPADKKLMKRIQAIDHILSDYKRVLEINEVLLKENEELRKFILEGVTIEKSPYQNYRLDFLRENFIPIKEIKEKFKKNK